MSEPDKSNGSRTLGSTEKTKEKVSIAPIIKENIPTLLDSNDKNNDKTLRDLK